MPLNAPSDTSSLPLAGCRVVERSSTAAAAYAGRLLAAMGAQVVMIEPLEGSPLRHAAPMIGNTQDSALFAYLSVGKRSLACDPSSAAGRQLLANELEGADILLDDTPLHDRWAQGVDQEAIAARFPALVHVSILPFGSCGTKSDWDGVELNLLHSGGEGYLLPNGLSQERFPDRAPLKIYGQFGSYQGGAMAAFCAMSAWWAVPVAGGQYVDVSVQDAILAVGAFALQRLGDGSLEHRSTRSFRYGGVFEALDGYIELLTLEDRQWAALVQLMGAPAWATDEQLKDPLERSRRGRELNDHIREWMALHPVDEIVQHAQRLGVPAAKYRLPTEIITGEHERARGLFAPAQMQNGDSVDMLVAPFQFRLTPLPGGGQVPALGEMSQEELA